MVESGVESSSGRSDVSLLHMVVSIVVVVVAVDFVVGVGDDRGGGIFHGFYATTIVFFFGLQFPLRA